MNNEKNLYVDEYPNPRSVDTQRLYPVLTKREYFAAMALQGLLTDISNKDSPYNGLLIEKYAVECADALIKELEK